MDSREKPLITISMMTYNQERYVKESVRGMLDQTYNPLEIVISDDCSKDKTWDIVLEEVRRYKEKGGTHLIVLNRNEQNMGIAAHSQKVAALKHGRFIVCNGGDDISFPERVARIAEVWKNEGDAVSLIIHSALTMDVNNNILGSLDKRTVEHPLGAVFSYDREKIDAAGFPEITEHGAYDDQILARRAQIIGRVVSIDDKLLYYRIGSGVSSILRERRDVEVRGAKARIASCMQTRLDIRSQRGKVSDVLLDAVSESNERLLELAKARVLLFSGRNIREKFKGFLRCSKGMRPGIGVLLFSLYLLPEWICDPILDTYTGLKNWLKARFFKRKNIAVAPIEC